MIGATPPAVVPGSTTPALAAHPAAVSATNPAPYGWQVHVVRDGETVHGLALKHRTTIAVIAQRNKLRHAARVIHPGQRLWVPRTTPARTSPQGSATSSGTGRHSARTTTYRVRAGDTLSHLAVRFRSTPRALQRLNALPSSTIRIGQVLRVPATTKPGRTTTTKPGRTMGWYVVRRGDTLFEVAHRHRTTVSGMVKANRLRTTTILVGQRLRVPLSATTTKGGTSRPGVAGVPSRAEAKALIVATARRYGVDPKLALAIGWQESGWNQNAHSSANARGIMQVIPDAGRWASGMVGRPLNLRKAEDNVVAGVVILKALTRMTHSRDIAIASYYQGYGSVTSRGMYEDTKQYVANVKALYRRM